MWSVNTIVAVAVVAVVAVVAAGRILTTIMWSVNRVIVVVAARRIKDIDLEVDSFIMRSDDDNRLAQNQ